MRRGDLGMGLGIGTPSQNLHCICGQTVTDSGILTIDSLQVLSTALSNGTIADPIRLSFRALTELQRNA